MRAGRAGGQEGQRTEGRPDSWRGREDEPGWQVRREAGRQGDGWTGALSHRGEGERWGSSRGTAVRRASSARLPGPWSLCRPPAASPEPTGSPGPAGARGRRGRAGSPAWPRPGGAGSARRAGGRRGRSAGTSAAGAGRGEGRGLPRGRAGGGEGGSRPERRAPGPSRRGGRRSRRAGAVLTLFPRVLPWSLEVGGRSLRRGFCLRCGDPQPPPPGPPGALTAAAAFLQLFARLCPLVTTVRVTGRQGYLGPFPAVGTEVPLGLRFLPKSAPRKMVPGSVPAFVTQIIPVGQSLLWPLPGRSPEYGRPHTAAASSLLPLRASDSSPVMTQIWGASPPP